MTTEATFDDLIKQVKDGSSFESLRAAQQLADLMRIRRKSSERVIGGAVKDAALAFSPGIHAARSRNAESFPDEFTDVDPLQNPVDFIASDASAAMRDMLDHFPDKEAAILRAILVNDRPKDEVCAEFGVDRNYLRVLLHRARSQFRRAYLQKIGR
jgi:DNA-directed RNA polymerase specialized sigma24 family protein